MARRGASVLDSLVDKLAGAAVTHSSTLDVSLYPGSRTIDRKVGQSAAPNPGTWISQGPAVFDEWVKYDLGSAKTIDSWLITGGEGGPESIRNGKIQSSDDGAIWTDRVIFIDLFGVAAPGSSYRAAAVNHAAIAARYWRLLVQAKYPGGNTYVACMEVLAWNSADLGAELAAAAGTVYTYKQVSGITGSKTNFTNRLWNDGNYGWYQAQGSASILELDFGSVQYVGGLTILQYLSNGYMPALFRIWTSASGAYGSWTLVETLDLATLLPGNRGDFIEHLEFARIYSTRYLAIEAVVKVGANAPVLMEELFLHATLTPAVPPDPTAVAAGAGKDDASAIEVRWSQAAGDDNAIADLRWTVERRKDGGAWGQVASSLAAAYFVDPGLAAGAYDYRVKAVHAYHARESAFIQTPAAVTVPATAGGGGGGPFERGLAA